MKQRYRQDCFNGGVRMKTKILTIAPYQGMKEIINDKMCIRDSIYIFRINEKLQWTQQTKVHKQ